MLGKLKKYYDMSNLVTENRDYYFIFCKRGNGKTYFLEKLKKEMQGGVNVGKGKKIL